jgi:hypothetical protein
MGSAVINHGRLATAVQNAINGMVARIIADETAAAQVRLQERIAAETRGLVAKVISDSRDYGMNPEVNVVIHIPDAET